MYSILHILVFTIEGILILSLGYFILKNGLDILKYLFSYLKYYLCNKKK